MIDEREIRLFTLHSAVLQRKLDRLKGSLPDSGDGAINPERDAELKPYIMQYGEDSRRNARRMANYYMLFHMLENEIRSFVVDVVEAKDEIDWWKTTVPQQVRIYAESVRQKEDDEGISYRSSRLIDYVTFGHLSEIIRFNWDVFGGLLSGQKGVEKVMRSLNMLRGPIAHCSQLSDDEVDRLMLAIRDWSRVSAGPNVAK